jgi:aspartate/methionine/tyrosine aminotransferase
MPHPWIANRMAQLDSSGIRRIFDLSAKMVQPVNLSIGQPDFDVPEPIRQAAIEAISTRKNGYSPTQGIAPLIDKLQARVDAEYHHADRRVLVTSGTSGGLVLALLAMVNPGDEVIVFDPYFVSYPPLVELAGGRAVFVDTYPTFHVDLDRLRAAITPRTKAMIFASPANPTGVTATEDEARQIARLAEERNIALVSDEIYHEFCYDAPFVSPAKYNNQTIVVDGFSKTYAMTGWRLGFAHGPVEIVQEMAKLQQYTFVCAPQPVQWAGCAALDVDMTPYIADYRRKRDRLLAALAEDYEIVQPGGAFYVFPKVPHGTATSFVERAIARELLIIPGQIFSRADTHFRVSYAASDETIERGIEILKALARIS